MHDITYINWLIMVRAGLLALEFYTPETRKWRQAHMQARFAILQVLLEAGGGLVEVVEAAGGQGEGDGRADLEVRMDREKVMSVGMPAIEEFLLKLST